MSRYLVAKSRFSNGTFEVHLDTCELIPSPQRHHLGIFLGVGRAIEEARQLYPRCQACDHCCGASASDESPEQRAMSPHATPG